MKLTVTPKALRAGGIAAAAICLLAAGCATAPSDGNGFRGVILETRHKVAPALVYIRVVREALEGGKNEKQVVAGSGVVITPDGELLTNHHVVDKATEIRCQLSDGTAYTARKIGRVTHCTESVSVW